MAPKRSTPSQPSTPSSRTTPKPQQPPTTTTSSTPHPATKASTSSSATSSFLYAKSSLLADQSAQEIALTIWRNYLDKTPQRVKLIDVFMAFLVVVGAVQFIYCVLAGNYPFNAFLSGFSATVGQFVLTASLRIQSNPENKSEFKTVSPERAFADFVFGSLILHFFCVNFIN